MDKHCYEFSPIIVDKLITCTPWLVPDNLCYRIACHSLAVDIIISQN